MYKNDAETRQTSFDFMSFLIDTICRQNYLLFQLGFLLQCDLHSTSHCLYLDLNGKRPGITSDGNFSSYLIGKGQLISKAIFVFLTSSKKRTKKI